MAKKLEKRAASVRMMGAERANEMMVRDYV